MEVAAEGVAGIAFARDQLARVGQWVNAGQLIASEGNTGNSFGCHVHFETYVNGSPVNPIYFMADRGISV